MGEIELRPAGEEDRAFLYLVHREAFRDIVRRVWGSWDERLARERFERSLDIATTRVIRWRGRDVGRLSVVEQGGEIFLANIAVAPPVQGRGIGSAVLCGLLADADARGKPVSLRIIKGNPVRRLYLRLGFVVTGETDTHETMRRAVPP